MFVRRIQSRVGNTDDAAASEAHVAQQQAVPAWFGRCGVLSCMALYIGLTGIHSWDNGAVDDAHITFRYASQLLAGEGLVFNAGERVEGYTSLTWVLLLAALRAVGADYAASSRILGVLFGLGTIAITAQLSKQLATRLWACLALATALPAICHFSNGLETALMTMLLTLFAALRLRAERSVNARVVEAAVAALLTWTRPEGAACCAWWMVVELAIARGRRRLPWLHIALTITCAFLLQTGLRWLYYGDWIATSARAKLLPLTLTLPHGLADFAAFGMYTSCGGLLAIGALYAVARAATAHVIDARRVLQIAAFSLGVMLLLAASGGDSYGLWRFYVPILPCLCWLCARGVVLVCEGVATQTAKLSVAPWLAHTLLLALCGLIRAGSNVALRPELSTGWEQHWHTIGRALRSEVPPETRLAISSIGIIPFESGLYTIDILGLTDPAIARAEPDLRYWLPGHLRHNGSHVLDRAPDLILLANGPVVGRPTRAFPWNEVRIYERDIVADPRFARDFELAHVALPTGGFVQVHVRKGFVRR